jgi:hypothetical protein
MNIQNEIDQILYHEYELNKNRVNAPIRKFELIHSDSVHTITYNTFINKINDIIVIHNKKLYNEMDNKKKFKYFLECEKTLIEFENFSRTLLNLPPKSEDDKKRDNQVIEFNELLLKNLENEK